MKIKLLILLTIFSLPLHANNIAGQWSTVGEWPFVAIHAAVLPDGRVVTYGSDGDVIPGTNRGGKGRTGRFLYDVWDPFDGLGSLSHLTLENTTTTDLFCSAQILLPDTGELLIAGGDTYTPGPSSPVDINDNLETDATTILSPDPSVPDSYVVAEGVKMNRPRWYATPTMLPNGDIFIQGGKGGADRPEIQTRDGKYVLKDKINTSSFDYWYPRNFLAPDGRIFGFDASDLNSVGATEYMYNIWPDGAGYLETLGTMNFSKWSSSSVMYAPGKVLHVSAIDNEASIININYRRPVISKTSPLSGTRIWLNLTLLPDGKVLATGGSQYNGHGVAVGNVSAVGTIYNSAEIWDPSTGQWTVGASAANGRLYHSVAILLPDATVLTAGGGLSGPFTQHNGEVYSPPYLFNTDGSLASRPVINSAPEVADYGEMVTVGFSNSTGISDISLVKMGSVTHSFNVEQRIIKPDYTVTGQSVTFRAPSDPRLATPGFYMLFIFNNAGVPSIASTIKIDGNSDFEVVENAGIPGYNSEVLNNRSSESCKQECVSRSWCKSADFMRANGTCILQPVSSQDVALNTNYPGDPYDHFSYKPRLNPVGFGVELNAGIPGHNQEILSNQSLAQCQSACIDRAWCKSIDFARASGMCILQPVAEEDVTELNRNYVGNPYDHYYYEPRLDAEYGWGMVANAGIPGYNTLIINNSSIAACQHTCEGHSWCESIDYDRSLQRCYLQNVSEDKVSLKTDYPGHPYDHYYLKARRRGAAQPGFAYIADAGIPGYNVEIHHNTTLESCQQLCAPLSWCKSIDFGRDAKTCILQDVDKDDVPLKTDYPGNPYDHYYKSGL